MTYDIVWIEYNCNSFFLRLNVNHNLSNIAHFLGRGYSLDKTHMESMFDIYVEIFIYIEPHDIVYIKTYFKRNMLSMNMSNIFTSGSKILPRKNHVSNNRPILLLAKMFAANQTSIVIFDFLCSLITLSSHTLQ